MSLSAESYARFNQVRAELDSAGSERAASINRLRAQNARAVEIAEQLQRSDLAAAELRAELASLPSYVHARAKPVPPPPPPAPVAPPPPLAARPDLARASREECLRARSDFEPALLARLQTAPLERVQFYCSTLPVLRAERV